MKPDYTSPDGKIRFYNCSYEVLFESGERWNLAIIDSPYGIGEDGGKNHTRGKLAISKNYKAYSGNDINAPSVEYWNNLLFKTDNQIIWGANHFISKIPYDSSCWIVWDKKNGKTDFADCELAWTSFKSAVRKFEWKWQGMLQENMKNKQDRIHPNEKPIQLYKWLLNNHAQPNQRILDTFGGSMSHAIAVHEVNAVLGMNLQLDICEIDKDYFDAAVNRFKNHIAQTVIEF